MTSVARPGASRHQLRGVSVPVSIQVILAGQDHRGGYVACPTYGTYGYAWLRDGAFCAYAMDLHDQHDSAAAFHRFVTHTILSNHGLFDAAITADPQNRVRHRMPPTRYTLTGELELPGEEAWPNFQLNQQPDAHND